MALHVRILPELAPCMYFFFWLILFYCCFCNYVISLPNTGLELTRPRDQESNAHQPSQPGSPLLADSGLLTLYGVLGIILVTSGT